VDCKLKKLKMRNRCVKCECPGIGGKEIYCVDCKIILCEPCSRRLHHPHTKDETHSLEEVYPVEDDGYGIYIFTPLAKPFFVVACIWFFWHSIRIPEEYAVQHNICPTMNVVYRLVSWVDSSIFYLVKQELSSHCATEDAVLRVYMDLWVRSIVTDTDSFALVGATLLGPQLIAYIAACFVWISILSFSLAVLVYCLHDRVLHKKC